MIAQTISESSQVSAARRAAVHFAQALGFGQDVLDRIGIVVTEAGTNLLRHAGGGSILTLETFPPGSGGLQIIAVDTGPGIESVEKAVEDGFSRARDGATSMGAGLGAIHRQSDHLEIYSDPHGTTLTARFHGRGPVRSDMAGLIVPKPGYTAGGDGWACRPLSDRRLFMLIDVLGHGPKAQEEAQIALERFHAVPEAPLEETEAMVSQALEGGRGAAVLFVDVGRPGTPIRAVGMGNIKGEIVNGNERRGIPSMPGISGAGRRRPQPTIHDWPPGATLVLSTDGLKTTPAHEPAALFFRDSATIAATLYYRRRRDTDDCGVVVVKAVT